MAFIGIREQKLVIVNCKQNKAKGRQAKNICKLVCNYAIVV